MEVQVQKPINRWQPRFSLLSVLLTMALVASAITIWQLWSEVGPLREEVRRLRDEVGELSIDDPMKLHAIQIDTRDELTWKWRVWIPKGRVYIVRCVGEPIPKDGFPTHGGTMRLQGTGEQVLEYRIDRDRKNGEWYGQLVFRGGITGGHLQSWVTWTSRTSTGGGVGMSTESFEPDARVELIRHRVSKVPDSSKIEDPSAGFMIWLEPAK